MGLDLFLHLKSTRPGSVKKRLYQRDFLTFCQETLGSVVLGFFFSTLNQPPDWDPLSPAAWQRDCVRRTFYPMSPWYFDLFVNFFLPCRLTSLSEIHSARRREEETVVERIQDAALSSTSLRDTQGDVSQQYTFFQETRGYVRDLVECLDEKVRLIIQGTFPFTPSSPPHTCYSLCKQYSWPDLVMYRYVFLC